MKYITWALVIVAIISIVFLWITGVSDLDTLMLLYETKGILPFIAVFVNVAVVITAWFIKSWELVQVLAIGDMLMTLYALFTTDVVVI